MFLFFPFAVYEYRVDDQASNLRKKLDEMRISPEVSGEGPQQPPVTNSTSATIEVFHG